MIEIAEVCGFCAGAENAFNKTLQVIKDNPGKRVVLFKDLLHNRDVVEFLKSKGVVQINKKEEINPDDIIIIRAHGETKETLNYFNEHRFTYVDCTCRKVNHIHTAIEEKYNNEYKICIIGEKKTHPEVTGSYGWCNNEGFIITDVEDIKEIDNVINGKIFVVAQTTVSRDKFNMLSEMVKKKFTGSKIEVMDSLCDLQERIQNTSVKLSAECGTMIVIGDENSANTEELFKKCKDNCPGTVHWLYGRRFFYDMIMKENIDFSRKVGITGGASTPKKIIEECKYLLSFKKFYEAASEKIRKRIKEYNAILLKDNNPLFQDVLEQFAAIGESEKAKCIRGALLMLGYKVAQVQNEDYSLDLAAAYELFETSILVHDDVFDKANQRRDITTVHEKIIKKHLAGHKDKEELIRHNAQSIAVCTGDLGFYFLNQIILDAYKDDKNLVFVLKYFNDIVIKTIKGELLDIVLPLEEQLRITNTENLEKNVLEIDTLKTAGYTTAGPFCLGLTLGGEKRADLGKFEELLLYLGIAFQIKDDWLNIYGSPEQGKPVGNDISEFKMTLFYSEVCKQEEWKEQLLKYYGSKNLSVKDLEAVKNIFEKSGATEKVNKIMADYLVKCRALLDGIKFKNEEDRDILLGFILYLELRSR